MQAMEKQRRDGQGNSRAKKMLRGGRRPVACLAVVAALLGLGATGAGAQVRGTIFGPGESAFPLAVARLSGSGGELCSQKFGETVARDLDLSGLFRVTSGGALPAVKDGSTPETVDFGAWSASGVRLLVKGTCEGAGEQVTIEARLFDLGERRQLGGKRYTGGRRELRRMAHRFADEVMRLVTGERGPFDSRIAFVSTRGGRAKEIWEMGFDGEDARALTRNGTINLSPSWAPDRRELLFTSYKDGPPRLFAMDVASGQSRMVLQGPGLTNGGRFSPDGNRIAVSREESRGDSEIVVIGRAGGVSSRVTSGAGIDVSPAWSPDGRRLAWCSTRAGSPQIFVGDAGGGSARRVTFAGSYNTSPAWSPKGDKIAYTGRVGGRFQVFVVPASGGEPRQLTTSGGDNTDPAWSPDGRYLLFSSTRDGAPALFVMDELGLKQRQLLHGATGDTAPAWSTWLGE
jgi:TolB protein